MTRLKWRSKLTCDGAAPVGSAGRRPATLRHSSKGNGRKKAVARHSKLVSLALAGLRVEVSLAKVRYYSLDTSRGKKLGDRFNVDTQQELQGSQP